MTVRRLAASDREAWTRYVFDHPRGTWYHRLEWKDVIEESFGHDTYYLLHEREGRVAGVLPVVHLKSRLFGSILCSMPFLNFGGVLADDVAAESSLLVEGERLLQETGADFLELRHLHPTAAGLPAKTHKVSMTLDLTPGVEGLWAGLERRQRRTTRRSLEQGLEIAFGGAPLLDEFYLVLSRGWRWLGTPIYQRGFFRSVVEALADSVEIAVVRHQGRAVAASLYGFHQGVAEGMWTYSMHEYRELDVNYFLYWQMIQRTCERGMHAFHLGRSTAGSGNEFAKRKWNAEAKPLYWEYVMNGQRDLPALDVDNPKYELAIRLWRRLPLRATQWIGPYLARSIP